MVSKLILNYKFVDFWFFKFKIVKLRYEGRDHGCDEDQDQDAASDEARFDALAEQMASTVLYVNVYYLKKKTFVGILK